MSDPIANINKLLDLEKELDQVATESGIDIDSVEEVSKPHLMVAERYVGGETRYVCSCGRASKPAREKVTLRRMYTHTLKTGHLPATEDK